MKKTLYSFAVIFAFALFFNAIDVKAYSGCEEYGYMAYPIGNSCQCMSGYSFGKDFMGNTSCVSNTQLCTDKLGYNARYSSLYDRCECGYGYVIDGGRCTSGDTVCHSKHGIYSSYNDSDNSCECDSGYTLDDRGQCEEKQNNVYFTLKELDTDNKLAVIKSNYDYSYYSIRYNAGCYASSFKRYLNHQIVVNLGTDYYLDTWDKIVLQDDDEVCDIVAKEKVDSLFTLIPEEEDEDLSYAQIAALNAVLNNNTPAKPAVIKSETPKPPVETIVETATTAQQDTSIESSIVTESTPPIIPTAPEKKVKWYMKIFNWFKKK